MIPNFHFGIFSYAATTLIFTGLAIVLRLIRRLPVVGPKHWKTIGSVMAFNLLMTGLVEAAALKWGIWAYNPERTFHLTFWGAEIESYLFVALVTFVVASATLRRAEREDRNKVH